MFLLISPLIMLRFSIRKKFWNVYDFWYFLSLLRLPQDYKNRKNRKETCFELHATVLKGCYIVAS